MSTRTRTSSPLGNQQGLPTPAEYGAFVGQIELADVWLVDAHVRNDHGARSPRQAALAIESAESTWSSTTDGFDVRFPYVVRFLEGEDVHAEIGVTFGLHFTSPQRMTDEIFSIFKEVNLPVNTWPFLREFVSTTLGRMGWLPFTLPAYKIGVRDDDDDDRKVDSPPRKRKRSQSR